MIWAKDKRVVFSSLTRRGAIATLGASALATASLSSRSLATEPQAERAYEGESPTGNLQQALEAALSKVDADLGEGGVSDAMANWRLAGVTGQRGGIAGFNTVKVRLIASRTPPYPGKSSP